MQRSRWRVWGVAAIAALLMVCGAAHDMLVKESKVVKQVPTTHKVIAFTFDDGPHPGTTLELLRVLRQKEVKATFFILGRNAEQHHAILEQVAAEGHELANHGYSHRFAKDVSADEYVAEVDRNAAILASVGARPVLFRPPGGSYNDRLVAKLQQKGYTTVLWSVDCRDWARPSVEQVVQVAAANLKPGNIFLFHDGQDKLPTPQAVSILIDKFRAEGYQFVTLSELLQYYEVRH